MGAAARQRGDALIRCQMKEETQRAYAEASRRAFAEVTIVGRTARWAWDMSVWYETSEGQLFGFTRLDVWHAHDIKDAANRAFRYWCRQHGLLMERVYYPAALDSSTAPQREEPETMPRHYHPGDFPAVERLLRRALHGPPYARLREQIRALLVQRQSPVLLRTTWPDRLTAYEEEVLAALAQAFDEDNVIV
jgi:hypothetical protein